MAGMTAAIFDGGLRVVTDYPEPEPGPGWARIRVALAGICKTDQEILKGYLGFRGVLGHEFVGVVDRCAERSWIGRRVVGEINVACGRCAWCSRGLGRHCPSRRTLGIDRLDGAMADCCCLPVANLLPLPAALPDEAAVLIEPLAAACEILEQLPLTGRERVVVLGDGRLGILCAWVLATLTPDVTLLGHHPGKLRLARWRGVATALADGGIEPGADLVVEATGSGQGIATAMALCRPRGTIVLKSTVADPGHLNLAPLVIGEQTLLGSRCGRFSAALDLLAAFPDLPLARLITARYPLHEAPAAFARASAGDALKVLLAPVSRRVSPS